MAEITATARQLIKDALQDIGVVASGESMDADMAQDALRKLNYMLASWSAQGITVPYFTLETIQATTSPQAVPTRPMRYTSAIVSIGNGVDYPVEIINQEQYESILNKQITGIPRQVWWDELYPASNLYFYFVPDKPYPVTLTRWDKLALITELDATIGLPGEYLLPIETGLAVVLAPGYGASVSTETRAIATESYNNILRLNSVPVGKLSSDIRGTAHYVGAGQSIAGWANVRGGFC